MKLLYILFIFSSALFLNACDQSSSFYPTDPATAAPDNGSSTPDFTGEVPGPGSGDETPLSITSLPDDLSRGLAFLPETHTISTEGGSGGNSFSVSLDAAGGINAAIDEFGELTLSGVEGVISNTTVTVTVEDSDGTTANAQFNVDVAPYSAQGAMVLDQEWTQSDGSGNDLTRHYDYYVPSGYSSPMPLVLVLHGAFGNKNEQHEILEPEAGFYVDPPTRRWLQIADEQGVIVAFPNGLGIGDDDTETSTLFWNDCRGDQLRSRDDLAFIDALPSEINALTSGKIDSANLFVMGISNGGMMSYRIARESTLDWNAIAATVANEPQSASGSEPCATPTANQAPSMLMLFSTADTIMPYAGGNPGIALLEAMIEESGGTPPPPSFYPLVLGSVVSGDDTISQWQTILGTGTSATTTGHTDLVLDDGSTATTYSYSNSTTGKALEVIRVDGGKHNLPSREFITPDDYRDQNNDIEAIDHIWHFFQSHSN
ncbi:conserved hypothetical protein [gamma proteobacterium HTCC5015]|nr:conserved hypothetical protein [gamma proteobacterium HTCC5015]